MFPARGATSWQIPLYQPLTGLGPRVIGTVCGVARPGQPRACEETLFYVDTGSSHSALPATTFARLGVETIESHFATIENAAGETGAWAGGLIPEVRLDGLTLHDVVATVHDRTAILGADVLTTNGWRIDLDRGTLLLGAQPTSPAASALRLPIRGFPERTIVELTVQGRAVPLLLDTGAPVTVVDVSWLKAAGLPLRTLNHGWPLSERDRTLHLGEATDADLRLGAAELGRRQLVGHPRSSERADRGLLGLDLLSDYAFGVAGGALELVRRPPSPLAVAAERVNRWRDVPRCPGLPGCVAAWLETTDAVRVHVRAAASSPRAWRYLFGCVDGTGQLSDFPIWFEVGIRAPAAGEESVVVVAMSEKLRQTFGRGCKGLSLLDVNPVLAGVRPMTTDVEAEIAISTRRARLD